MIFLVQIKEKIDGTFDKGTSQFSSEKEAMIQLHIAMSSAMQKEDTKQIVCVLLDNNGVSLKREFYRADLLNYIP